MATAKKTATSKTKTKAPAKKAAEEKAPKGRKKAVEAPVPVEVVAEAPAPKAKRAAKAKAAEVPAVEVSAPAPLLPPLAEAIISAIREGRAVEFLFADAESNAPRTFEPRQLAFDALSQAWYVFGWDRRYNAERHHRVDLLSAVNPVEGVGRGAQGPYAEGTPGNHIGGWLGGEPIPVKALLQKQWVFAVKQAPPAFPKFHLQDKEDGRAEATFTATDLRAIARWVMQFGDGITVQEPQRLADRLRQVASVWGGKDFLKPAPAPLPPPPPRPEFREERPRPQEAKAAKPEAKAKVEVRVERL